MILLAAPIVDIALRIGLHHTHVDKSEGQPDGFGPRIELSAELAPVEWVSFGAVGALSHYSSYLDADQILGPYTANFLEPWIGVRVLAHPHWRAFAGITVWKQWEREADTGSSVGVQWSDRESLELVVGGNVARFDHYLMSVAATYSSYSQYGDLEHVTVWSLSLGVTDRVPIGH